MSLFVLIAVDRPDALDLRMEHRDAHLAYMDANAGQIRVAGPFLDEAGRMTGSLVIVEAQDMEAAQALFAQDPFAQAGLFESTRVRAWRITRGGLA